MHEYALYIIGKLLLHIRCFEYTHYNNTNVAREGTDALF